ncbi:MULTISPECIES: ammonium transporter [unclassified Sphingopyxis]|uniref:ammonium transporter n=1 Tax=unclassified Sphingopyxis TaxID=2614943 RepID=UPI000730D005|nr:MULTISPECIES: ammonium transporter [unclassified Sphingopyxis]KTE21610.1 ammonia channel protein [Sphingopyxis sp. H057]KTE49607.1 ammonia channel protein [Sphingopyxis sp. H073]KTE49819.1 ammonia channel protein [Sphingopyxis sp. H071]KTE58234.1 ammonia channel protein [Sphingopyxis sp. H107]KTE62702.1 ammonia channel protein [Sphingopyxis sp. H100]
MTFANKIAASAGAAGLALFAALPVWAQEAATAVAAPAAPAAEAAAPAPFVPTAEMVNKGDVAWMLVASALVLLMSVPALALFYGGLVRAKNMLSVLMQVLTIVCVAALVWFSWGYSMAFTSTGSPFPALFGGLDKAFLAGVDVNTFAATFSNGVYLPEYVFVIFQMTFACITPALIVGAFAERVKFTPLIIFTVLWMTFAYFPIAHMVWYWAGPDFLHAAPTDYGLLWGWGALDFAGGTVVHINAGIAGLVGCLVIGPRIGYNTEPMPPHNLVMTMIGASLLWIGWFGFNAGSGLEANAFGALAFINTFVATAAAGVAWAVIEQIVHKKPSLLGAVSGVVAGLVAITPAAGFAHPGTAIILGAVASLVCFFFVTTVKKKLKYDDSLDVFGIHAIGGIVGAIGTGFVANPAWGGQGWIDYTAPVAKAGEFDLAGQVMTQIWAVGTTVLWTGTVSVVLFLALKYTIGLRPSKDVEQEGLDLAEHGERAYNM